MKRKLSERILSFLLSFVMVFSSVPLHAFAETTDIQEEPEEVASYYLFIDQQLEFGTIEDVDDEKEYEDVFEQIEAEDGEEPVAPEKEPLLLYKSSLYEVGTEVELLVKAEEGYEVADIFIEKVDLEKENIFVLVDEDDVEKEKKDEKFFIKEYEYDEETSTLKFVMPETDVRISVTLAEKENEVPEVEPEVEPIDPAADFKCEENEHIYEAKEIDATCEAGGYTVYTCSVCGDFYNDAETDAIGHNYSEEITKEASATEKGEKTFTCSNCGNVYTEEIPMITKNPEQPQTPDLEYSPSPSSDVEYGWEIIEDGTLRIYPINGATGILSSNESGDMDFWPWYNQKTEIKSVVVEAGVIGGNSLACMFFGCNNLTELDLSNLDTSNVASMDNMFADCNSLNTVKFGSNFSFIGADHAFDAENVGNSWIKMYDVDNSLIDDDTVYTAEQLTLLNNNDSTPILAGVWVKGYTYNIVYESSEGENLGSIAITKPYGEVCIIDAPDLEGYKTPMSQEVTWDSKESKTITFVYEKDTKPQDVYIEELFAEFFYGADHIEGNSYVWNVNDGNYESGHSFSFRVNYKLSGGIAPVGSVSFTIPKSILYTRNGEVGDIVNLSIPSKEELDKAVQNKNDSISEYAHWTYIETNDELFIYNFKELEPNASGYIEISYLTNETTFSYSDMVELKPFTCEMATAQESKDVEPITVKINTNAKIAYVNVKSPIKHTDWNDVWGEEIKPENVEDYYYLVWTVESYIYANQTYNFKLDSTITGNLGGMEVLGYKFSGQSVYTANDVIHNQTQTQTRYDYVITAIPLSMYENVDYWVANNKIIATVDPVDQVDEDTQSIANKQWTWEQPLFKVPSGNVNVYNRADGSYRDYTVKENLGVFYGTVHRASSLDFDASEYSRFDMEDFSGYNNNNITITEFNGFQYASWVVGYSYPWTYDHSYDNPLNPNAYGKIPVRYELVDDGVYLTDGEANSEEMSNKLTNEDFKFTSLGFSWYITDAIFDGATQAFKETKVSYTEQDIVKFYGKFGNSDEWVEFGNYNLGTKEIVKNDDYVKAMTENNIIFNDSVDCVAYKLTAENTHYYTELFTVAHLTLKNSDTVIDYISGKTDVGIINNNYGDFYYLKYEENAEPEFVLFEHVERQDIEYARVSQGYSTLDKSVTAISNNVKEKKYTISWKIDAWEEAELDVDGNRKFVSQNGGTFYDLLPAGALFNKRSLVVMKNNSSIAINRGFYNEYELTTIENYKGTGRTMLIVQIYGLGENFTVYYDTIHTWDSIADYGKDVYNPVAYKTGNSSISNGFPDNGGMYYADGTQNPDAIKEAEIMSGLSSNITAKRFIYSEEVWNITETTAASLGLTKKVKSEKDVDYSQEASVGINGNYSYQLRYMNPYTVKSKDMVIFDSLENYNYTTQLTEGSLSDWRGELTSIDLHQLIRLGIDPIVYYSSISNLNIEENRDISDASVWKILDAETDLSTVKAIAIDISKSIDGSDFILDEGKSVLVTLYMKAPETCPDVDGHNATTYNNVYLDITTIEPADELSEEHLFLREDYTSVKLVVAGDFGVLKVGEDSSTRIKNIQFRLVGTSAYGTSVDEIKYTDKNGKIQFENIEMGTYILQEHKTSLDWMPDQTEYKVVVDNTGRVWIDGEEYTNSSLIITSQIRLHGNLEFYNKKLGTTEGIVGTIYRIEGVSDYGNETMIYAKSEVSGKVSVNLEMGTYSLTEASISKDYKPNDISYTIKVDQLGIVTFVDSNETDKDGNDVSFEESEWFEKNDLADRVTLFNASRYFDFNMRIVDSDNTSIKLEGAMITLSGVSNYGIKVSKVAVSDKNGLLAFKDVEDGAYILKQTKAPEGLDENGNIGGTLNYLVDETEYIVTIDYRGNITIEELEIESATGYYVLKNLRAYDKRIVITKIWNDGLTNEERISQGLIPKLHLTNRDLSVDGEFHTHTWDNGEILSHSSCAKHGEILYTCTDCGMTNIRESGEMEEHVWDEGVLVGDADSCVVEKLYTCANCGVSEIRDSGEFTHNWAEGEILTPPTCCSEGATLYTCVDCGAEEIRMIATTEHSWDEGVIISEPSCTEVGEKLYTCTVENCGTTKTSEIPMSHDFSEEFLCTKCRKVASYLHTSAILQGLAYKGSHTTTLYVSSTDYDYHNNGNGRYYKVITFIPDRDGYYGFAISENAATFGVWDATLQPVKLYFDNVSYYPMDKGQIYYMLVGFQNPEDFGEIKATIYVDRYSD